MILPPNPKGILRNDRIGGYEEYQDMHFYYGLERTNIRSLRLRSGKNQPPLREVILITVYFEYEKRR